MSNYYEKGDIKPIEATEVTIKRLAIRRKLTTDSHRLVLVLVGLPGRGKSFIARKLYSYFVWRGSACKVFNVGKYRRAAVQKLEKEEEEKKRKEGEGSKEATASSSCNANFFDAHNEAASKIRQQCAVEAMEDMLAWMDLESQESQESPLSSRTNSLTSLTNLGSSGLDASSSDNNDKHQQCGSLNKCYSYFRPPNDRVAIFDATNSTKARRDWIVERLSQHSKAHGRDMGVIFVESICDDKELLEENFKYKVLNSPDFKGLSTEDAIADLRKRVQLYEDQYETIADDDSCSYIKIFNLSSKLLANQIYGRMSKIVIPALMAWNIGTRPIWICRAGQTLDEARRKQNTNGHHHAAESLGVAGRQFRDALQNYLNQIGKKFITHHRSRAYSLSLNTGTSISGGIHRQKAANGALDFPCKIMTSTMPRAWQTVLWENSSVIDANVISNLNPLDKGDFSGLELQQIQQKDKDWYSQLLADPYNTRFPGGECYRDLVTRLESCIIDMEQAVSPVLVVSHVSVIQVLLAYFRGTPVNECTKIAVPMHTVIQLTPVNGGSWLEQHVRLDHMDPNGNVQQTNLPVIDDTSQPIWNDADPS